MDQILSEFISHTGAEPSFARDFLDGHNWDLISALKKYTALCNRGSSVQSLNNNHRNNNTDNDTVVSINGYITTITNNDVEATASSDTEDLNELPFLNGHAEIYTSTRLSRGFSNARSNNRFVSSTRQNVANDLARTSIGGHDRGDCVEEKDKRNMQIQQNGSGNINTSNSSTNVNSGVIQCYVETPSYTFTLPNFANYSEDFRKFLEKDLIETATSKALENTGYLNWWTDSGLCQKLWPLATTGDGNCLLHAASLGMWGFHDRLLMLRKALHLILTKGSRRHALWRRWRWQQSYQNKEAGLIFSEDEWRREWENIVRLASPQPRSKPTSAEPLSQINSSNLPNTCNNDYREEGGDILYESLEEIHVFALAHVLKRPIMVIADTVLRDASGEAFAPILFGGIYLPLECYPSECHRSPLVLCYDAAHFSALVPMQPQNENSATNALAAVPVTDKDRRLLPLHFCCDPGPDFTWWTDEDDAKISAKATLTEQQKLELIDKYMDVVKLTPQTAASAATACKKFTKYATLGGQLTGLVSSSGSTGNGNSGSGPTAAKLSLSFTTGPPGSIGSQENGLDASDVSRRSRIDTTTNSTTTSSGAGGDHRSNSASTPTKFDRNQRWRGSTGSIATHRIGRLQKTYYYLGITRATLSKFTRSLKKRLKSKNRSKLLSADDSTLIISSTCSPLNQATVTSSPSSLKVYANSGSAPCKVTLNDLRDASAIVAAKLHTEAHHQFMNEMIDNYLKAARQRFDAEKSQKSANTVVVGPQQNGSAPTSNTSARPALSTRRERLSRSFSATSVMVKCMNGNCDGQGSHQTNFLCDLCFKTQKQLMESFTTSNYYQVAAATQAGAEQLNKACTLPFRRESPSHVISSAAQETAARNFYQTYENNNSRVTTNQQQAPVVRSTNGVMTPVRAGAVVVGNGAGGGAYPIARSTFYTSLANHNGRADQSDYNTVNNNQSENGAAAGAGGEYHRSTTAPPSVTVVQPLRLQHHHHHPMMMSHTHNPSTHSMTSSMSQNVSLSSSPVSTGSCSLIGQSTPTNQQQQRRGSAYRSIETTRYGVNSVTTSNGVTYYCVTTDNGNNTCLQDERQSSLGSRGVTGNGQHTTVTTTATPGGGVSSSTSLPIAFCCNLRCPGYDPHSYSYCAKCAERKSAAIGQMTSM